MIKNIFKFLVLSVVAFTSAQFVYAQTASILPPAKTTFFDSNGKPLANGKIDFYIPGTTTRKMTWQDAGQTIPNTNPVILDTAGRAIILGDGSYRQRVTDKNGNLIWDQTTSSTGSGGGGSSATIGDGDAVGTIKAWAGLAAPSQYVFAYGQEFARSSYPEVFAAITSLQNVSCVSGSATLTGLSDTSQLGVGTAIESACLNSGSTVVSKTTSTVTASSNAIISATSTARFFPFGDGDGSATFNLPDLRGRTLAGRDNMGGIAASRLSLNGLGVSGGVENQTLALTNLPSASLAVTIPAGQGSHQHGYTTFTRDAAGGPAFATQNPGFGTPVGTVTDLATLPAMTGTAALNGDGTALSILQPTQVQNYIIKVLPDTNPNSYFGVASIGGMYGVITCGNGLICVGNDISVAAGGYVLPPANNTELGGVFSSTCATSNWFNTLNDTGTFGCSQPDFTDLTGTIDIGQIVNNSITNAKLSQMGAATIRGNPTVSTGNVQDFTIQGLTNLPVPNGSSDYLPIYDHLTGTIKNVTPNAIASSGVAGVASIGGMTGVISCGAGTSCISNTISATGVLPSISNSQILANTSGSTTTPIGTNATTWFDSAWCNTVGYIVVRTTGAWVCSNAYPANIVWFGADPTGVSDSATAINNALASSNSLYIPKGEYYVASTISYSLISDHQSLTINGDGQDVSILAFADGMTTSISYAYDTNSVHIKNLTFATKGNGTAVGITLDQATPLGQMSPNDFTNVGFRGYDGNARFNYWSNAIVINAVSMINFNNVTIYGPSNVNDGIGINLRGKAGVGGEYGVIYNIMNCNFFDLYDGLYYGDYVQGVTVNQSNFTNLVHGIFTPGGAAGLLTQLTVSNSQFGPVIGDAVQLNTAVAYTQFSNNLFLVDDAHACAYLPDALYFQFVGNMCIGQGTPTTSSGFTIGTTNAGGNKGLIEGNVFRNLTAGIALTSGSSGNTIGTNSFGSDVTTPVNNAAGNANAIIGEIYRNSATTGGLTTTTATNVTTLSLTAGTWDCNGNIRYNNSGNTAANFQGWISTTSATQPSFPNNGAYAVMAGSSYADGTVLPVGSNKLKLTSTTTVYLGTLAVFSAGTPTVSGGLSCLRETN